MTPLIRPSATFSPQAGRRTSREIPRPAKGGEGAAKRRVRGRVITAPSAHCAVRGLRMTVLALILLSGCRTIRHVPEGTPLAPLTSTNASDAAQQLAGRRSQFPG